MDKPVTLAAIAGAHGVAGEVRLKLFTDDLAGLKRYRQFNDGQLTLKSLRPHKDGAIARFAEIADRNGAESFRGTAINVRRADLPPLAEGEYYHSDLIGLACKSTVGEELGMCIAVHNFGAGDIIEIQRPAGKTFLVPMNADAVPEWRDFILVDAAFVE